jgi:TonB-linked SusC/RagA family outer membrane protein
MNKFSFYKGGSAFWYLILFGFLLTYTPVPAKTVLKPMPSLPQQTQISGIITDGTTPLPGVTVAVKGQQNNVAISDFNGQYILLAAPTDTLTVSFMGFKTAIVPINGRKIINIQLREDATMLQEVKINAGYYSVIESERTGSIARITAAAIETQPVTNVLAAMQGRMAGVNITQTTGIPGGGFDIKIRGQNSLRTDGNNPLYIIDGVPYAADPIGHNQTATTFPTVTSPLNSIDPNAIESIEILKDADATAIYGSRGANGVVLITTKKGKAGTTSFSLKATSGAGTVTRFLKLMNTTQYLEMRKQAFQNDGLTSYNPWDYDINGTWDQSRNTDWQNELLGNTALFKDIQGTLSGGSERTQFLLSGNYHSESSVFKGPFAYKKGGAQININHHSEDNKFKASFSSGYTLQDNVQPAFDFSYEARSLPPNAHALYAPDGSLNWENGTWENPLRNLNAKFESKTKDLIANTLLSYEVLPGLLLKSSFGYTDLATLETRIAPSTIYNPAYNVSSDRSALFQNTSKRSSWIIEPQINWEKKCVIGKIGALIGASFQQQTNNILVQSANGYSSNSLIYNLAAAKYVNILVNEETQYKYQAFFGRLNYNWQERYIVNLTARRDGSSRFGPGNQFANFGAIGAAWLFSNERFLKDNYWLSFGKIRASIGTTGNDQIGDYQFLNTYTTSGISYNGTIGLQPSRLFNPNFGWETNKKLEAAVELGFLQDRIFTTAAWYRNRSSNQLVGMPLPGTTGFTLLQSNLDATVENKGLELTLRTANFNNTNFSWTTSINLTLSQNKLLRFPGLESSSYNQQYSIGEPLNIALLYKYKGINAQTGVYEFEDTNNDGVISFPEDKQTAVNLNPKFFGGLQNQLRYKNWKLDFLFQFVKQKNRSYPMGAAGMMSNQQTSAINSWQQPGDQTPYQIYTTGNNYDALLADYYHSESDASVIDASFVRLKNIALSFDVPLNRRETQCKLLLQGQNLLTFTKFNEGDPEFTSYGFLPPLKVITAGIQLTF